MSLRRLAPRAERPVGFEASPSHSLNQARVRRNLVVQIRADPLPDTALARLAQHRSFPGHCDRLACNLLERFVRQNITTFLLSRASRSSPDRRCHRTPHAAPALQPFSHSRPRPSTCLNLFPSCLRWSPNPAGAHPRGGRRGGSVARRGGSFGACAGGEGGSGRWCCGEYWRCVIVLPGNAGGALRRFRGGRIQGDRGGSSFAASADASLAQLRSRNRAVTCDRRMGEK